MSQAQKLVLDHERFGTIEAPESAVLYCDGLPGFPEARRLLILEHDRSSPFAWLVCFEIPGLAFVVVEPGELWSYRPEPHLSDLRAIGADRGEDIDVLAIANIGEEGAFANLAAPILVNPRSRRATQAILSEGSHPIRAPLLPNPGQRTHTAAQIESKPHR